MTFPQCVWKFLTVMTFGSVHRWSFHRPNRNSDKNQGKWTAKGREARKHAVLNIRKNPRGCSRTPSAATRGCFCDPLGFAEGVNTCTPSNQLRGSASVPLNQAGGQRLKPFVLGAGVTIREAEMSTPAIIASLINEVYYSITMPF